VKDTIPDGWVETLSRNNVHSASEPILQEILHFGQIVHTVPSVQVNLDKNVDVTVGARCTMDDRAEESERFESAIAQEIL
jgi:hypothetical protein